MDVETDVLIVGSGPAVTLGPGTDYEDIYGGWARLREVGDAGRVLVRPDNHVCYRSESVPAGAAAVLRDALLRILGRRPL